MNAACGACHSDLHVIKGDLNFPLPCILGHEITGEVVEHGPSTDTKVIQKYSFSLYLILFQHLLLKVIIRGPILTIIGQCIMHCMVNGESFG